MKELFDAAMMPVNIFPTILMILIIIYWITVIVGALDMDFLNIEVDGPEVDVDIDVDADIEIDADADIDADTDADFDGGTDTSGVMLSLNSILSFFNLGKVPFMLLLSFFILPLWSISVLANHYMHNQSVLVSIVLLAPNIIASLLISKVLTTPFALIYTRMTKNSSDTFEYQGKVCTITLTVTDSKFGQAEIHHNGNTHRINVLTTEGKTLHKEETGLVINYLEDKKCYLIEPYKI